MSKPLVFLMDNEGNQLASGYMPTITDMDVPHGAMHWNSRFFVFDSKEGSGDVYYHEVTMPPFMPVQEPPEDNIQTPGDDDEQV